MKLVKLFNLTLAFLLELAMLASFAYWGFSEHASVWAKLLAGVGLPLAVIIAWGLWLAPKARNRLKQPWLGFAKSILFLGAALALVVAHHQAAGYILAGLALFSVVFESSQKSSN